MKFRFFQMSIVTKPEAFLSWNFISISLVVYITCPRQNRCEFQIIKFGLTSHIWNSGSLY